MVKEYFLAVLYRILLCWVCLAALALFISIVDVIALNLAFSGTINIDASIVIYSSYFLAMLLAAIIIPIIWAIVDAVCCVLCGTDRVGPRYVVAFLLGLMGGVTMYLGLTEQYPALFLTSWLYVPVMGYLWEWYADGLVGTERFSAGGGVTYVAYGIAYLVCVSGAFAPVLATYVDRRRIKSSL
ncbi:hypothetical protein ABIB57_004099 [Devosia sp. UYZn731]|uniref:hypothetical protein n=1 Tax=Devosia sp. UYZn731 TaxID=3156345 RepID=UPI00339A04D2